MFKSGSPTLKNPTVDGININSSSSALDIRQRKHDLKRYFQFFLLLLSAGTIYPLIYLRQNFENTVLEAFHITSSELGGLYSTLGVIYCLSYLPSGWLADKFQPRLLVAFSLAVVGGLGLWFSSYPSLHALRFIFIGWGLAAGLCFWASLIKGVKLLATANEQGRFFGILDGGRGLVEASLATAALSIFAYMSRQGELAQSALKPVIFLYSLSCLVIAVLIFFFLDSGTKLHEQELDPNGVELQSNFGHDLKTLLCMPQIWLLSAIIFTGYQLFWATYSFSAFLQDGYGMTAIAAGAFTVAKQWTRPIGGIGAGFLGDKFPKEKIIIITYFLASLGFLCLVNFPQLDSRTFLFCMITLIGMLTYSIRGLYWALLDSCHLPLRLTGLAIGLVSLIGYLPDVILPMINSAIFNRYPGAASYKIYFTYIAVCGFLGALLTAYFQKITKNGKRLEAE